MKLSFWVNLCVVLALFLFSTASAQQEDPKARVPYLRGPHISFHVGSTHPLGDLDSLTDANIHARVNLDYAFTTYARLMFMAGLNQFTAESFAGVEHPRWINLSINCKALFPAPTGTGMRYYLQGGCGYYLPKTGSNEIGFNLGLGGQIPIGAPFDIEFGIDYHHVFTDDTTQFLTWQLGVLFR